MAVRSTGTAARVLFTQYVTPTLANLGFERSQRSYRRYASSGDAVVVDFQVSKGTTNKTYRFYINVALAPRAWVEWLRGLPPDADLPDLTSADGLVTTRLQRPGPAWPRDRHQAAAILEQLQHGQTPLELTEAVDLHGDPQEWSINTDESAHTVGQVLADLLPPEVAEFVELLDRNSFKEKLEREEPLPGICPRGAALAVLYAEEGMSNRDIEKLLAQHPKFSTDFVTWVRQRAATMEGRTHRRRS